MKNRGADRRSHPRFEIVGTSLGSVEMWTRLELRNLGRGGALLGPSSSLRGEGSLQGILTLGAWRQPVHAVVRHFSASARGLAVGVEFFDALPDTPVRIAGERSGDVSQEEPAQEERRRYRRVVAPQDFAFESRDWVNVELRDVSMHRDPAGCRGGRRGVVRLAVHGDADRVSSHVHECCCRGSRACKTVPLWALFAGDSLVGSKATSEAVPC